ncbi:hypothetical protein ATANTOWER_002862 [Ataeniobius toweri]|uniref:Uncharacterized protein n=1 Tax=Ataeniobius toweri TaxID=208326 RepID=A0ABU7ALR1_9TELE|nr:hypothetical protein [Ataeniobius toweri]
MAKFLVELLGCTLPAKGTSPLFEWRSLRHLGLGLSSRQQRLMNTVGSSSRSLKMVQHRLTESNRFIQDRTLRGT